jgi:hypothetical protein
MQFSRTERRSIIGGDASKSLPPKGSIPPRKTVMPTGLKHVRSLPLVNPPPNAKPSLRPPTNDGSPSLRPSDQAISGSKEIHKPTQRAPLTSSRDVPRKEIVDNIEGDKPGTPKPITRPPPSWDELISSSDKVSTHENEKAKQKSVIQETSPRGEVVEVSLLPPRISATNSPSEPVKISHQKSSSSGGLALPAPTSSSHSRSKSHTNPVSTSPPNISKMSTFQRVQQSLFLEEDLNNSGVRKPPPSEPTSRSVDPPVSHRPRPTSLTQPLRPLDTPVRGHTSPESKVLFRNYKQSD